MTETCPFCPNPLNPHDIGVYREVVGWVGGPKSDGMTLRSNTGRHAHQACIEKAKQGYSPGQEELPL